MKVSLRPTITNQNFKSIKNVKKSVTQSAKELAEDLYEKRIIDEIKKEPLISRGHPNWCDAPEDGYVNRTIAQTINYYSEDVEKMKGMTKRQMIDFKEKLYKEGKFYLGETLTKEEHESFLRSLGLDPEKYYIKD